MRKIIALMLALAMVLSFAACKGNKDKETTDPQNTVSDDQVNAQTDAEDTSTSDESTEASSDASQDSTKKPNKPATNVNVNVKPAPGGNKKPTVGNQGNVELDDVKPTRTYKITYNEADGKKILTIDGEEYDLTKTADVAKIRERLQSEPDLGRAITDVSPAASMYIGLGTMSEGSVLSYTYDPNGEFFYVDDINSWQKNFGFNPFYDSAAGFTFMYYDTVRLKFNYKAKNDAATTGYMIQLWKGQYGLMFIGCEIGLYKKTDNTPIVANGKLDHFECATENLTPMEMACYRVQGGDYVHLFTNPYALHWWSTGFVPGALTNFADRSVLVMEARMTFEDKEMARVVGDTFKVNGFKEIAKSAHNIRHADTFYVDGQDVVFVWRYIKHSKDITILAPTTTTTTAPSSVTSSSPASESAAS